MNSINSYYSGGADRPGQGSIEKSLVIRQVRRIGGNKDDDLGIIAGFCVDPTIRINTATVYPAPFKMITEYILINHQSQDVNEHSDDDFL